MKPCKITKLDDTFWRVDWEGDAGLFRGYEPTAPAIAELRGLNWCFGRSLFASLEAALAAFGLTTDPPKEETAEDRVRADIAATGDDCDTTTTGKADLRAILAELDAVRADYARLEEELGQLSAKLTSEKTTIADAHLAALSRVATLEAERAEAAGWFRRLVNRIDFLASAECNVDMRDEAMGWCRDWAARLERKVNK